MEAGKEEEMEKEGMTEVVYLCTRGHAKEHGQMKRRKAQREGSIKGEVRMDVSSRGGGGGKRRAEGEEKINGEEEWRW